MLVCLLLGAAGYAPDAGIVAEQARTIDALKAEKADLNEKNAKLNVENAELKAEVSSLKGAAVATPRQLTFAAEPNSLANPASRMTYSGASLTDPTIAINSAAFGTLDFAGPGTAQYAQAIGSTNQFYVGSGTVQYTAPGTGNPASYNSHVGSTADAFMLGPASDQLGQAPPVVGAMGIGPDDTAGAVPSADMSAGPDDWCCPC